MPAMYYLRDASAAASSRERTPEGLLRARATITRAGILEYDASELGVGEPGERVAIRRTRETVTHPDTLSSIRGAAVTLGHPPQDVSPETWQTYVVGNVVGEPKVDGTGLVWADILIGRQDAITAVEDGTHELSVGYRFETQQDNSGQLLTRGPLSVNHVAIVPRGRAGSRVRIQDQEPVMDPAAIQKAIRDAVADTLKTINTQSGAADSQMMTTAFEAAMKPVLDSVNDMGKKFKEMEEKDATEKKEMAEKQAKEAADKLIADTQAARDAHWQDISACIPLIAKDALTALQANTAATAKDYMAAALKPILGDQVTALDEATLRGAMLTAKAGIKDQTPTATPTTPVFPPGIGALDQQSNVTPINPTYQGVAPKTHTATDAKNARDEYVKSLTGGYLLDAKKEA